MTWQINRPKCTCRGEGKMSETSKSQVVEKKSNSKDFKLEEYDRWWRSSEAPKVYTLLRYYGMDQDVVIPENVISINDSAFVGCEIHSLTLPSEMSADSAPKVFKKRLLKYLISTYKRNESVDIEQLLGKYPELEVLEFRNAECIFLGDVKKLSATHRCFEIRALNTEIKKIRLGYGAGEFNPDISLFAPYISPGLIDLPLRINAIDTFLSNPDRFPEDRYAAYREWIRKNMDKLLDVCMKYQREDILLRCLAMENMRLPAKAYDRIIEAAENAKNQELKASALLQKGKYYDLQKLAQREETLALNDMENPLRNHAMKQLWSWGKRDDDTVVIKRYKGGNENDMLSGMDDIEIPAEITGKTVTALSGAVFKDTKIRKVVIPGSVTEIYGSPFAGTAVEEVVFEGHIRGIPEKCFASATRLSSVSFPGNALQCSPFPVDAPDPVPYTQPFIIGRSAFEGSNIHHVLVQNAVLCHNAFCDSSLRSVTLRNVSVIPEKCFSDCDSLKCADIQGTAVIETFAFDGCRSLTDIHVSDMLYSVAQLAFERCRKLERIHLHHVRFPERIKKVFPNSIRTTVEFIVEED